MSTKKKRSPKTKAARKEKPKTAVKRKVAEEKKIDAAPLTKPEKTTAVVPKKKEEKVVTEVPAKPFYLAIRLLGPFGSPTNIDNTLASLKLNHKFRAVLLEKNGSMLGSLRRVKDYVTWGEVNTQDIATLLKERGELSNGMAFDDKFVKENLGHASIEELALAIARGQTPLKMLWQKGVVPVFRLHPPSGGFEASIKRPFGSRGELGYRGAAISHLAHRMM